MLEDCRDQYIISGVLNSAQVEEIFNQRGIYKNGINRLDIRILKLLDTAGALSLSALSNATSESQETVRESEAFLIKNGLISITNRRNITLKGKKVLESRN
jgi:Holliday junction resolvasome RuvABC ATP-dependent DNA helicase subunit